MRRDEEKEKDIRREGHKKKEKGIKGRKRRASRHQGKKKRREKGMMEGRKTAGVRDCAHCVGIMRQDAQ